MKASTKGAFLSGLVYPGLGQLVLGSMVAGWFLVLLTTAGLAVLIFRLAKRIDVAIVQLLPVWAQGGLDLAQVIKTINRACDDGWQIEGVSAIIIVSGWIAAVSHAYLLGRKLDRKTAGNP
jgi:TM2 domain-containing membrane protein YozV